MHNRKKAKMNTVKSGIGLSSMGNEDETSAHASSFITSRTARVLLAGAGFLADAYDLFVINMVLRLLKDEYPEFTASGHLHALEGSVASAALVGAIIGQLVAGSLADIIGRKKIFVATAMLITIGSFGSAFSMNRSYLTVYGEICFWRFFLGLGVGGEYPLAATVTSESSSPARRGSLMAAVFSMQGVGSILSVLVVIICLELGMSNNFTWRFSLAFGAVPSIVAFPWRLRMHETETFERVKKERLESQQNAQLLQIEHGSTVLVRANSMNPNQHNTNNNTNNHTNSKGDYQLLPQSTTQDYGSINDIIENIHYNADNNTNDNNTNDNTNTNNAYNTLDEATENNTETPQIILVPPQPLEPLVVRDGIEIEPSIVYPLIQKALSFVGAAGGVTHDNNGIKHNENVNETTSLLSQQTLPKQNKTQKLSPPKIITHTPPPLTIQNVFSAVRHSPDKNTQLKHTNNNNTNNTSNTHYYAVNTQDNSDHQPTTPMPQINTTTNNNNNTDNTDNITHVTCNSATQLHGILHTQQMEQMEHKHHAHHTSDSEQQAHEMFQNNAHKNHSFIEPHKDTNTNTNTTNNTTNKPVAPRSALKSRTNSTDSTPEKHNTNITNNTNSTNTTADIEANLDDNTLHRLHAHTIHSNTTQHKQNSILHTRHSEMIKAFRYYKYHMFGTALCWFLLDVDFYANNLFNHDITSTILSVQNANGEFTTTTPLIDAYNSAILCVIAIPGYLLSIQYIDKVGRKNIQLFGFTMMAVLFLLCSLLYDVLLLDPAGGVERKYVFLLLYALTFLFSNFGPNMTSFVIPGEIYPPEVRATCHGISAAFGKLGAATGAYFFPMLLGPGGAANPTKSGLKHAFVVCALIAILGAIVTYFFTPRYSAADLVDEDGYLVLEHDCLRPGRGEMVLLEQERLLKGGLPRSNSRDNFEMIQVIDRADNYAMEEEVDLEIQQHHIHDSLTSSYNHNGITDHDLNNSTPLFSFNTHPKVSKALFEQSGVLQLKDSSMGGFPVQRDVSVFKWNYSGNNEQLLPISVTCWPDIDKKTGNCTVTCEYNMNESAVSRCMEFDMIIKIPLPGGMQVKSVDFSAGDTMISQKEYFEWILRPISQANSNINGTLEFQLVPIFQDSAIMTIVKHKLTEDSFYPIQIEFKSQQLYCDLQVKSVTNNEVSEGAGGGEIPFNFKKEMCSDVYVVV